MLSREKEDLRSNLKFINEVPVMATVNETAKIFGLARHFVRRLALEKRIKHVRAGKKILINLEKFKEYLDECPDVNTDCITNKFGISEIEGGCDE